MSKILYIEDNDFNVYVVKLRLQRAGFEVLIAGSAEAGMTMAVSERPDLILMDLNLPAMDGWEATRRLKAAAETKAIPVIALSAHAMQGDRERAIEAGCDEYDTKPVDFARLVDKIKGLVASR
jgi:CheY-like chemotaxis protein